MGIFALPNSSKIKVRMTFQKLRYNIIICNLRIARELLALLIPESMRHSSWSQRNFVYNNGLLNGLFYTTAKLKSLFQIFWVWIIWIAFEQTESSWNWTNTSALFIIFSFVIYCNEIIVLFRFIHLWKITSIRLGFIKRLVLYVEFFFLMNGFSRKRILYKKRPFA